MNECRCGCSEVPAGRRSRYVPGHDAKHVSRLVREAVPVREALDELETPALQSQYLEAAERAEAKHPY